MSLEYYKNNLDAKMTTINRPLKKMAFKTVTNMRLYLKNDTANFHTLVRNFKFEAEKKKLKKHNSNFVLLY